jgi:hypothetical protein
LEDLTVMKTKKPETTEDYFDLYRSTEAIDKAYTERLVIEAYKSLGQTGPLILWARGLFEANLANEILDALPSEDYKKAPKLFEKALKTKKQPKRFYPNFGGGQFVAGVVHGQENHFKEHPSQYNSMSAQDKQIYHTFSDIGRYASLWYQWEKVCVCVERPVKFVPQFLPDNPTNVRLHCDDGPVVAWGDNYAMYYLNDVRVPAWLVNTPPKDLNETHYLKEKNIEIRREIFRKIGWPRLAKRFKSEIVDTWEPTLKEVEYIHKPGAKVDPYHLYKMKIPIDDKGGTIDARGLFMTLEDKDGLVSQYFEFIEDSNCQSAKEAFYSNRGKVPKDRKILLS